MVYKDSTSENFLLSQKLYQLIYNFFKIFYFNLYQHLHKQTKKKLQYFTINCSTLCDSLATKVQ